jgi:hypothetical protein
VKLLLGWAEQADMMRGGGADTENGRRIAQRLPGVDQVRAWIESSATLGTRIRR